MKLRKRACGAVTTAFLIAAFLPASPASAGTTARSPAVYYADTNTTNPPNTYTNPAYNRYSSDCTNFISQAMRAGQWPGVTTGYTEYWYPYTNAWLTVSHWLEAMNEYAWRTSLVEQQSKGGAYTTAQLGDMYPYDWGRGLGISHLAISVGYANNGRAGMYSGDGQGDYMDQHSPDRMHAPWNYGYLHPDGNTNPATMHIYVVPLRYASG